MARNRIQEGGGESQRQRRVGELIRRTLSETLIRGDIHDPDLNRMSITVSEVRVSPDMRVANVYVLPLGGDGLDEMMELLKRNRGELRRAVAKGITIRHAPELRFRIDDTFDQMDATRELMSRADVRRDIED